MAARREPIMTARQRLPVVAIVGRPNAGKSTLFNRLVGERKAIVHDTPGVTRDRNYAQAEWAGRRYLLVDTGGIESESSDDLERRVQAQSRQAVSEADAIVFLLDGKGGLNPLDREVVDQLRRADKPTFFAVNKLDSQRREANLYEFFALGLEPLFAISAEHGLGVAELMDQVIAKLPLDSSPGAEVEDEPEDAATLRVAVVGRPNVGKSTLINRLLGFERSVVNAAPGTTRDAVDSPFELRGERAVLVDTAGIRRKARIDDRIEQFSAQRSLRAVDRGDVILHVIDGPEGVTDQDAQILSYAVQRGKGLVLAVNKWDLMAGQTDGKKYGAEVRYRLAFLDFAPIAFISAASGKGVNGLLRMTAQVAEVYRRKVPTSALNQALQKIVRAHTPPLAQGRAVKFYYGTQVRTKPPTFALFVNRPAAVHETYRKYLVHHLRQELGLEHAPIRLDLRARREEKVARRS